MYTTIREWGPKILYHTITLGPNVLMVVYVDGLHRTLYPRRRRVSYSILDTIIARKKYSLEFRGLPALGPEPYLKVPCTSHR